MICFHSGCKEIALYEKLLRDLLLGTTRSLGFFCLKHVAESSVVLRKPVPLEKTTEDRRQTMAEKLTDDRRQPTAQKPPPEGPPLGSAGWLYDETRKEFVQPASYEQRRFFEKHGYVPHPIDRCTTRPRRLIVRRRA